MNLPQIFILKINVCILLQNYGTSEANSTILHTQVTDNPKRTLWDKQIFGLLM